MTPHQLIAKARSAMNRQIIYKLGAGGMRPGSPTPANVDNQCDCSGFVAWCLLMSRMTDNPFYVRFNGGWINTDAIVADANAVVGIFTKIATPRVGCLIVYPGGTSAARIGHVGIVSEVVNGVVTKVIHCSSGNHRSTGDAIQETAPTQFTPGKGTILAWFAGMP